MQRTAPVVRVADNNSGANTAAIDCAGRRVSAREQANLVGHVNHSSKEEADPFESHHPAETGGGATNGGTTFGAMVALRHTAV
jgi:hypothetical protein